MSSVPRTKCAPLLYVAYNRDESEIYRLSQALDAQYDALYSTGKDVLEKKQEKESLRLLESSKGIIILLDREGKTVSSEKLAETIKDCQNLGQSEITFIIGGSNGVSKELKQKAKAMPKKHFHG